MSNFRFIETNLNVDAILKQATENPLDWQAVSTYENVGGDLNPYGFMPIVMAVVEEGKSPKDAEGLTLTPIADRFTEIFKWLQARQITRLARAAFFKLAPGQEVLEHVDDGSYYLTKDRFHLSLSGIYHYRCGDEEHIIQPGTFFWFNNKLPHAAKNIGYEDRLTFVFDVPHALDHPANSKNFK